MTPKFCVNCKWLAGDICCHHTARETHPYYLVTGDIPISKLDAIKMRDIAGPCGPEGKLWVPK